MTRLALSPILLMISVNLTDWITVRPDELVGKGAICLRVTLLLGS